MKSLNPKKKFGQNFLSDEAVLSRIADCADITKDDDILEIGPGTGNLTKILASRARSVTAIEIDRDLIPFVTVAAEPYGNTKVINADVMKSDIKSLIPADSSRLKVVANIPYYITTPLVTKLLSCGISFESLVLLVQKEVAVRMAAPPGSKDCGAISYFVSWRSVPGIMFEVPPEAFYPVPKVTSALIRLDILKAPPFPVSDEELMFSLIRAGFELRRKTLVNAIAADSALSGRFSKEMTAEALTELSLDINIRAERLTLSDFGALADHLYRKEKK